MFIVNIFCMSFKAYNKIYDEKNHRAEKLCNNIFHVEALYII